MSGISDALDLISRGIKLVKAVNSALADVRNAPEEIQALRDRLAYLDLFLGDLQRRREEGHFQSPQDLALLERLRCRARKCVDDISNFVDKTLKITKEGEAKIDSFKWLTRRSKLNELSKKLDELESALNAIMNLLVS